MMKKAFMCSVCGLHYKSRALADKCHRWCLTHKSCSTEITKHSIELSKKGAL